MACRLSVFTVPALIFALIPFIITLIFFIFILIPFIWSFYFKSFKIQYLLKWCVIYRTCHS